MTRAAKIRTCPGDDERAARIYHVPLSVVKRIRARSARRGRPPLESGPMEVELPPKWDRRVRALAKSEQVTHSRALIMLLERSNPA